MKGASVHETGHSDRDGLAQGFASFRDRNEVGGGGGLKLRMVRRVRVCRRLGMLLDNMTQPWEARVRRRFLGHARADHLPLLPPWELQSLEDVGL